MTHSEEIIKIIEDTLAVVDSSENTEFSIYLAALLDNDFNQDVDAMEIVEELEQNKHLPECAKEFIVELLECEAEYGNAEAMNDLGANYYDGYGCEQSYEKAVYYYKKAAEKGNRAAQENLGYCYYYGRNMPADYEKAFHYFALGAFDGHLVSLYKIGDMYLNGYYVEKNEIEAFHIYEHCMDTMTDTAAPYVAGPVLLRLGDMFLNGRGTEKDVKSALVCYQKAEVFLYNMVEDGNLKYKKSLNSAIVGQAKAREMLAQALLEN